MKKSYNKPGINIEMFSMEKIVTASGNLSAEEKALNALNESGTTQNISLEWLFEEIGVQ